MKGEETEMKRARPLILVTPVAILVAFSAPAGAGKLPKDAKPMTAEEVTAIYSGNSALWKLSKVYFSPEKKVMGVFGKGSKRAIFSGEWSVTDNEICMLDADIVKVNHYRKGVRGGP